MKLSKAKFAFSCLVLAPVGSNYVLLSAISIGDFLALVGFILLYTGCRPSTTPRNLAFLSLFLVLSAFAHLAWGGGIEYGFYRLLLYCTLLLAITHLKCDSQAFWISYSWWGRFFSVSLLIQFALYQAGFSIPLMLPIPAYELDTLQVVDHVYRSGGWFREPSYLLLFLIPLLLHQSRSGDWKSFALCFAAAVVSTSSLTFVAACAVILDRFMHSNVGQTKRGRIASIVLAVLGAVLFVAGITVTQDSLITSRFLDILSGGGSSVERIAPIVNYFEELLSILPNPTYVNPIITLSKDGVIWLSSAAYMILMFGALAVVVFLAGMSYLSLLPYGIFLTMTFSTSFLSSAYALLFALGLHLCFSLSMSMGRSRPNHNLG
jgi:hypothetical protein